MPSRKDVVLLLSVFAASAVIILGTGAVTLPGTQTTNILCETPLVSNLVDSCNSDVQPGDEYKVTTEATVTSNGIGNVRYMTENADGSAPWSSLAFLSVTGANDGTLEIVYRDSGDRVVASDSKPVGDVPALETKTVTFEDIEGFESGNYERTLIYTFEYCSLVGDLLNDCENRQVKETSNFEVPKLPLGDY